jgi:YspA, cpYpsA-related SLOG family
VRILVCGSRRWKDRNAIIYRLADISPPLDEVVIVHGNAGGADRIAHQEAQKLGLLVEPHPADWERYGKRAGFIRNVEMLESGIDLVIAFWDGASRGTQHTMDEAAKREIPVEVIWQTLQH